ncbi:MAG: hypothetical protein IT289_07575 [Oligoflexia bacterium]|nr:hypothetical protein [Oligoflexia bacterium]
METPSWKELLDSRTIILSHANDQYFARIGGTSIFGKGADASDALNDLKTNYNALRGDFEAAGVPFDEIDRARPTSNQAAERHFALKALFLKLLFATVVIAMVLNILVLRVIELPVRIVNEARAALTAENAKMLLEKAVRSSSQVKPDTYARIIESWLDVALQVKEGLPEDAEKRIQQKVKRLTASGVENAKKQW